MVAHANESVNRKVIACRRFEKQIQVEDIVRLIEKHRLTIVAALNDLQGNTWNGNSGDAQRCPSTPRPNQLT